MSDAVTLAAEVCVLRALEVAGKRARMNRQDMGRVAHVQPWQAHTIVHLADSGSGCDRLLGGAWALFDEVVPDRPRLVRTLDQYVRTLIVRQEPHSTDRLHAALVGADAVVG